MDDPVMQADTPPNTHPQRHGNAPYAEPNPDTPELAPAQIFTLLPAELLQGGEIVVFVKKPSLWYVLLESLRSLGLLMIVFLLVLWAYNRGYNIGMAHRDLFLLAAGLGGVRLFWQFLEWLSRVYVLTDRRVIRVKGVLRVQVFETSLQQIQHTHTTFSLRERFFGLGSIHMATAGTAANDLSWVMLANPLETHRVLVRTLNRYR